MLWVPIDSNVEKHDIFSGNKENCIGVRLLYNENL